MVEPLQLSVRAASWTAAQCVRYFCLTRGIFHVGVDEFCQYLEDAATETSILDWDARSKALLVTGLGDRLPFPLNEIEKLKELLEAAREVTASQMYAAWTPQEVAGYLREAAEFAGLPPTKVLSLACSLHAPDQHGWGKAVTEIQRAKWPNKLFNPDALTRAG